jgi:hypothetical protein
MLRAALLSTLLAAFASAEDAASIEIRPGIKEGSKITRTMDTRGKGAITREADGASTDFECTMSGVEILAEEVLEAKDGRALKAKRRYERKDSVFEVPAVGKKEEKASSLVGRMLSVERKEGKSQATSPEKNVEPKDLASETLDDEWDVAAAAGKPAEHWKSAMKIGLDGSSEPGTAEFPELK